MASLGPDPGMTGFLFLRALPVYDIVHDVDKGDIVRRGTAAGVRMAVDGNKMDVQFREQDIHIKARAKVVPSETGQILDDDPIDLALFHQCHHGTKTGTVKVGAAPAVIGEVAEGLITVLMSIFLQHRLLIPDTDGLAGIIIVFGQAFVQSREFHRIRRAPKRVRASPAREAASLATDTKKTRVPEWEMYPVRDQMLRAIPARRNSTGQFIVRSSFIYFWFYYITICCKTQQTDAKTNTAEERRNMYNASVVWYNLGM